MLGLVNHITNQQNNQPIPVATIGFDGFIDTIVKLIKYKNTESRPIQYFNEMAGWGHYILDKKAANFSIELQLQSIKTGGNMPNMATALATLGIAVNCIGAMGYPAIDPLFNNLPAQCRLHSFANAGTCQAIEFNDGKIMLAGMDELNKVDWNILKERISIETLIEVLDDARLVGLLNWGELTASSGFWKGLLNDVLPYCTAGKNKMIFVDLSDCSSRSTEEIGEALELVQSFSRYGKVVLSVNHHEAVLVHNSLFETITSYDNTKIAGEKIFNGLKIDTLLVHNKRTAIAFRKDELAEKHCSFIESPKLLTGAGDNFNAGFCFAQLMDCGLEDSLLLAHLAAAHYIKNAESASWNDLLEAIKII